MAVTLEQAREMTPAERRKLRLRLQHALQRLRTRVARLHADEPSAVAALASADRSPPLSESTSK